MLTREGCLARQQRLQGRMDAEGWDLFATANFRTVYWLTGIMGTADVPTVYLQFSNGKRLLLASGTDGGASDEFLKLETYTIERALTDLFSDAGRLLQAALPDSPPIQRYATEGGSFPLVFADLLSRAYPAAERYDALPAVLRLRKHKEEDELAESRASLRLCAAAYTAARKAIRPGLTEVDVFRAMSDAVVREAGFPVDLKGDFACGLRSISAGGPPTNRKVEPGDLYVLDIFPSPHLYFGDVCRTFCVGTPTDDQVRAFDTIRQATQVGLAAIKPGAPAKEVYRAVKDFLDSFEWTAKSFWHHAGHGIGLSGHEAPRIIPGSDDVFEIGDVFTLEPAVYVPSLQGGLRLEDNYILRESGIENIFNYPMEL